MRENEIKVHVRFEDELIKIGNGVNIMSLQSKKKKKNNKFTLNATLTTQG